jgi:hypothetical protein
MQRLHTRVTRLERAQQRQHIERPWTSPRWPMRTNSDKEAMIRAYIATLSPREFKAWCERLGDSQLQTVLAVLTLQRGDTV